MKKFGLFILLLSSSWALAQQSYFTPEIKKFGVNHYKKRIHQSCRDLKERQDPILPRDVQKLSAETIRVVNVNFFKAFYENPKVRSAFEKDINAFKIDLSCQHQGNDCRARMLATAMYYYQQLRADIPGCAGYVQTPKESKNFNAACDTELRYRQRTLQGVQGEKYGTDGAQLYKKQLLSYKNNTTLELFNIILQKDKNNLHICNPVDKGEPYKFDLEMDVSGDYFSGIDPEFDPITTVSIECVEEKVSLLSEFLPTSFDENRATTGRDEVEPLRAKVESLLKDNTIIVTDVTVISSSSRAPFYTTIAGKKVLDPASDETNLRLAKERSEFAKKAIEELKAYSAFDKIKFDYRPQLSGPAFEPTDLNDRFVTRMTSGYLEKLEVLHKKFKKDFEEVALVPVGTDLLDSNKYMNLFQAKFKPFQGFRLSAQGFRKEDMKCRPTGASGDKKPEKSAKQ